MNRLLQTWRLLHINVVLVRHGLDEIILDIHLFRPLRFLLYVLPWNWVRGSLPPRGVRIRRALEELGPVFVKFGQALSVRPDLVPEDIATELASLQDRVPPFAGSEAMARVAAALDRPLDEAFLEFDKEPFASASIAQVHGARLHDGKDVVVKVVRPGIERIIRRDVGLLYTIADLAARYWRDARRLRPREVVAEYEKIILDELDLMREAASASQLRRNFEGASELKVPEVYWEYTRPTVMVMERIYGIPISDTATLSKQGFDLEVLAQRGVEIFFTQVFSHNFFHADMHPGNIFVARDSVADPQYIAVDFGIMGSLMPADQHYLAENFLAFFNRDYQRVAELHVLSEWVPPGTRVDEFEAAIRSVCEPIFERPLKDISFGHLLVRLFQTARRFDMEVQPQLVLLQKTLLNIEGLGRQLYPDLDLWQTAKPFFEDWMDQQLGRKALFRELRKHAPRWGEALPRLPGQIFDVLEQAREGRLRVRLGSDELNALRREMRAGNRRTVMAIVGAALLVSAAVILGLDGYGPVMVAGMPVVSWALGGLGIFCIFSAWPDE